MKKIQHGLINKDEKFFAEFTSIDNKITFFQTIWFNSLKELEKMLFTNIDFIDDDEFNVKIYSSYFVNGEPNEIVFVKDYGRK